MSPGEARSVHWTTVLVGGTGLAYAWARYLGEPADEFAIHHPLQPLYQHLHVLAAPLLVFAIGLVWREHVWKHFVRGVRSRRRSGMVLLVTLVPMIASGYLLQVTVDPTWRRIWIATHLVASGAWLLGWGAHFLARWLQARRRRLGARALGIPDDALRDPEAEVGTLAAGSRS